MHTLEPKLKKKKKGGEKKVAEGEISSVEVLFQKISKVKRQWSWKQGGRQPGVHVHINMWGMVSEKWSLKKDAFP